MQTIESNTNKRYFIGNVKESTIEQRLEIMTDANIRLGTSHVFETGKAVDCRNRPLQGYVALYFVGDRTTDLSEFGKAIKQHPLYDKLTDG